MPVYSKRIRFSVWVQQHRVRVRVGTWRALTVGMPPLAMPPMIWGSTTTWWMLPTTISTTKTTMARPFMEVVEWRSALKMRHLRREQIDKLHRQL